MIKKIHYYYQGKEVRMGDTIKVIIRNFKTNGAAEYHSFECIKSDDIEYLVHKGIITKKESYEISYAECVNYLAKSEQKPYEEIDMFLQRLYKMYHAAFYNLVLKQAALLIDERYTDHISKSDEIWYVSLLDMDVHRMNKRLITSYKNFAAFRSEEDALEALEVLKPYVNEQKG